MQAGLALERMRLNDEIIRHANDAYFRSLVQNSADIILIIDEENRIQYASPSADSIFGDTSLADLPLPVLVMHPENREAEVFLARARADGGRPLPSGRIMRPTAIDPHAWSVHAVDGGQADVEVSAQDLRSDSSIGGLVVTMRDVTERRRLERELHYRSSHDLLTGLENRLAFTERLDAAVAAAKGSGRVASILFADLDDLKMINDAFGHGTGDAVLATVGERLRTFVAANGCAPRDTAARLGGDEFVVLLGGVRDGAAVDQLADQLVATLGEPVDVDGHEVTCRASVGVATTSRDDTAPELLRNADLALYAAKGAGKGQWRHYESWMRSTVMARLELRASLERAVDDGALLLHYQPILDLEASAPAGFEALVRWQHPTEGLLFPDQFIDVAEESGLIVPIGLWVLATAMRDAVRWTEITDSEPYVGVNVSARQFRGQSFTTEVRRLLKETGLAPHRLMLEITESLLLRDDDGIWQDMQALRRIGVRIAIDDFGTGFSSLSYLRQVPLDVVKLDRLFIQTMTHSPQQRELVAGIVRLTNVLGLQVIAEGIETDEERALAIQAGCAFGQGYLFSRPIPDREAHRWLAAHQTPAPIGP
jgi:diguanylate cyclase (GGDEF)-like protein/PAS domain S-box-containing protein